ncbi:MAG: inorganic diphosphatase [Ardenticatenales bacterium]|nr:inorganic diphosphatase [Ardenticatenales bacterium]
MALEAVVWLGRRVRVVIDRPMGSRHPRYGFAYPVNYGYVPGTMSGDGEELDAYVLGVAGPVMVFEGECVAVIHRLDDDDDKLVVVPAGISLNEEQIRAMTMFQERFFTSVVMMVDAGK